MLTCGKQCGNGNIELIGKEENIFEQLTLDLLLE